MEEFLPDQDVEALVKRFDRSSPNSLLLSMAAELLRLGRAHAALQARVRAMETLQTIVDRVVGSTEYETVMPRSVSFNAADSLQTCEGLYALEYDAQGGAYRWTGPEPHFSFQFFIDRREPARFRLRFGQLAAPSPPETIRCFVDGEAVQAAVHYLTDGVELTGLLPTRLDQGGSVLTFVCPDMLSPSLAQGSVDQRRLGVTFQRLKVEPLGM